MVKPEISLQELRRGLAVGLMACELGLDQVPGVVLADVEVYEPQRGPWIPPHCAIVRVWGGDRQACWKAIGRSPFSQGIQTVMVHRPAGLWSRFQGWLRWRLWSRPGAKE